MNFNSGIRFLFFISLALSYCLKKVTNVSRRRDVTKKGNGEREAANGKRKSGNELSAETSIKIQNGGPKNERDKEEDKERNSCLG